MLKYDLLRGDILETNHAIADGSVDLILTDLPYGTIKGLDLGGGAHRTSWDTVIDTVEIFKIANRILRKNGRMILFAQQPFTTELIVKADPNIGFNYSSIWLKDAFANGMSAKRAPVNYYEDILVFTKIHDLQSLHPHREYVRKVFDFTGLQKFELVQLIGQKIDHFFRFDSPQYALCTETAYAELVEACLLDAMPDFKEWAELRASDVLYKEQTAPVFNLPKGAKSKSNVYQYKKDYAGFHPTQKPVALIVDLIETYSNPGDLVVDLTMGSGTTGEAAVLTGRSFAGGEMTDEFFNYAEARVADALIML